jgi:hypothetical protein
MGQRLQAVIRASLLRTKIHHVAEGFALDPHSADYLYLVQQRKRLSLATSIGRLRPRNILAVPFILPIVLVKAIDLWIANQIIRAMINEYDLLRCGAETHNSRN